MAVIGATGRTGSLLVKSLLAQGTQVKALVRSVDKAKTVLPTDSPSLSLIQGNLSNEEDVGRLVQGCSDVVVTTGALSILGLSNQSNSPQIVDYEGMLVLLKAAGDSSLRIILVSTLGITRVWSRPISFLLEFLGGGVMWWKEKAETALRQSGHPYIIVRPGVLGSNGVSRLDNLCIGQGDKISGCIDRATLADLITLMILKPLVIDKCTFEVAECSETGNLESKLQTLASD